MTKALTSVFAAGDALISAEPHDKLAMALHIAQMHQAIDIATANPDDFYYAVVIVGKDGKEPVFHGTVPAPLLASVGAIYSDQEECNLMADLCLAGMDADEIFFTIATAERPGEFEFEPELELCTENVKDDVDFILALDLEAVGFKQLFSPIDGVTVFSIGGDVAGKQPGSGTETEPCQDTAARAAIEGDLNGDGVVDQADEDIRLALLADDGNPHVGE